MERWAIEGEPSLSVLQRASDFRTSGWLRQVALTLTSLVLASCTPWEHWISYPQRFDGCGGFPSREEAEKVLEEYKDVIGVLLSQKRDE